MQLVRSQSHSDQSGDGGDTPQERVKKWRDKGLETLVENNFQCATLIGPLRFIRAATPGLFETSHQSSGCPMSPSAGGRLIEPFHRSRIHSHGGTREVFPSRSRV